MKNKRKNMNNNEACGSEISGQNVKAAGGVQNS